MTRSIHFHRDVVVGLFLLVLCGTFLHASFDIPEPLFDQMSSALWPRIILAPLTVLSFAFLVRALLTDTSGRTPKGGIAGWLRYYANPLLCFALFLIFLLALPYLGMLIGGMLFVFFMLNVLGGWSPRHLALHAAIAAVMVGGMWSIFTFGLGVILPEGELLSIR